MLNLAIALTLAACQMWTPASAFATYHDRQPVHCAYQGDGYIGCYDVPGSSVTLDARQVADPSGEGYTAWAVSRNYFNHTTRWVVGDYARELATGSLVPGDIVTLWVVDLAD